MNNLLHNPHCGSDSSIMNLLKNICEAEDITLFSCSRVEQGIAINDTEEHIRCIAYSPELSGWAQVHTIVHEIAHHILGHLDCNNLENRERNEYEARTFASAFMAIAVYFDYRKCINT